MKTKKILIVLSILFAALVLVIAVCNLSIIAYSSGKTYNDPGAVPVRKVGLVLGTSPTLGGGRPNPYFTHRIEAATELYRSGKISYIIVSGDNRRKDYNEPEAMKQGLVEAGIPEERVYLDYAGLRTLDSVVRAKEIFGQESFTVISQKFHNERAVFLARRYGLDVVGYNAKDVDLRTGVNIREVFARVKVFVDFAVNKKPRHLGEEIEIP